MTMLKSPEAEGHGVANTNSVGATVYVSFTGGTGVSITVQDSGGNTLQSGLSTFTGYLPPGFSINFGAFSVAPTSVVAAA